MIRVIVISDDPKLHPILAPALGKEFHLVAESNADAVKALVSERAADVLLLDLDSTFRSCEEQVPLYERLAELEVAVVGLTDDGARPTAIELVSQGLHSYCRKPPILPELKGILRRAYEHTVMKRELQDRDARRAIRKPVDESAQCDCLIGASPPMRAMYDLIRRVARLNASVLITGESGTGKELIAQAIHNLGERAKFPFVAVACGAIPETLIESELFGHEKGAFTGSAGMRLGYFEQASNGTLFLDEIGELSLSTQVKLLRALQQREFTRLGSSRPIPLKARVILATHRDLDRMVSEGTLRLDLYYRINVITIKAPALADRPEDIPLLADHFVKQYAHLFNTSVTGVSKEALDLMQQYEWPGNVRQLENVIQSACLQANGEVISSKDLPEQLQELDLAERVQCSQVGSFERLLRDYKVKLALKAIQDCDGNKTLAARSLSISRAYLHRLIRVVESGEDFDAA